MIYLYLEIIKAFLEIHVCRKISLKRPDPDNAADFCLVPPVVTIGWPAPRLSDSTARRSIPGIAVGFGEDITDDGGERLLPIQLAFIVYASGTIGVDGKLFIDNSGYHDLLNLMDSTANALRNAEVLGEQLILADRGIRWRPANELEGDFWLGAMEFTLQALPIPNGNDHDLI